jgi:hypothetical protein
MFIKVAYLTIVDSNVVGMDFKKRVYIHKTKGQAGLTKRKLMRGFEEAYDSGELDRGDIMIYTRPTINPKYTRMLVY